MKKILIVLSILATATSSLIAQEYEKATLSEDLSKIDLHIAVDLQLFEQITTNTFISQNPTALIMGLVVPDSYEKLQEQLDNKLPPEFNLADKGEKTINGVKVLFIEGTNDSPEGLINCSIYCLKRDAESTIMFMGMVLEGADQTYVDAIDNAAKSVIKQ